LGATGQRVRELNELLGALTLRPTDVANDVFDVATVALVEAFQRSRGLPLTGVVDTTTWERLSEARWQLGARLLYLTRPYLRGDDVAELQVLLAQLGFNPGRIDGIFGPQLDSALSEFQRNCALDSSGALTKATLQELTRVRTIHASRSLVNDARDLAGFDPLSTGSIVLCGESPLLSGLARSIGDSPAIHVLTGSSHQESSDFANSHNVTLVLSFQSLAQVGGVHLHYWASYHSHSRRGELVASAFASALALLPEGPRVEVTGMALPILRETRMTTVHIEHGDLSEQVLHLVITALEGVVEQVIHRSA
jgi:N-acetylmuramoyl-L-alanine amidase